MNKEEGLPEEYSNLSSEEVQDSLERITDAKKNTQQKEGIHTYTTDIAEEVKNKNMSVIKIALAEQQKKEEHKVMEKKAANQKFLYIIFALIFVLGAALIIMYAVTQKEKPVDMSQTNSGRVESLIFTEDQTSIDATNFSRVELIEAIKQKLDFVKPNGITNIVIVKNENESLRLVTGGEFVSLIGRNAPGQLSLSVQDTFMIGSVGEIDKKLFIITTFDDFESEVSIMREWEPFMLEDMSGLFAVKNSTGIDIFSKPFQSEIVLNKESRILRDDDQNFVLGYMFLDRNTMVVASDLSVLQEVFDRYVVQTIQ